MPGDNSPNRMDALVWAVTELIMEPSTSVTDRERQIFGAFGASRGI